MNSLHNAVPVNAYHKTICRLVVIHPIVHTKPGIVVLVEQSIRVRLSTLRLKKTTIREGCNPFLDCRQLGRVYPKGVKAGEERVTVEKVGAVASPGCDGHSGTFIDSESYR